MSRKPAILVTGGAGYIGSHTAKLLDARGYRPVVYDDLSSGHRGASRWGEFVLGDIRDAGQLEKALVEHGIVAAIHLAGLIEVGRSVERPDLFYDVNVNGTRVLLDCLRRAGVRRLVFSSSAAVYGQDTAKPVGALIREDDPKSPASPYGETKLAGERMIEAYCAAFGLSAIALRYFNAAGCDPAGAIGEAHRLETHLIPLAIDAALGRRGPLKVFGDDYPTPDGSCLRDYVHVEDLAEAHLAALEAEQPWGAFEALNVGAGRGHSVLEVVDAVGRAVGRPVPHTVAPRRPGDPPSLVADPGRARQRLDWRPRLSSLQQIVDTAAVWRKAPVFGLA